MRHPERPERSAPGERLARAVVRAAALVVPQHRRAAWREEWESEIWHHLHGRGPEGPPAGQVALVLRCLGAVPHAIWIRGEGWTMDSLLQDFRFAARTMARRPGFALVAVGTLALGIGGNTAVFSVVNGVLLRPLPLETADRLVWIWGREFNGVPTASVSPPDYLAFAEAPAFEELAAYSSFSYRVVYRGGDRPTELTARNVSHDLLAALGATPALGRGFTPDDTAVERAGTVMISHGLWGRLYGFDRDVLGQSIVLDGESYTVVGILREGLDTPIDVDVWVPLTFGAEWYGSRASHFLRPIGLLRPGVTTSDAQSELDAIAARLEAEYPETNREWYPIVHDLRTVLVGSIRPALVLLSVAVGLVLLIACANVASVLLARSVGRRGEIAVRVALGAERGRIVRQLVTESVLLSLTVGAAGVALAYVGVRALVRLQPTGLPRIDEVALDATVLTFAVGLSVVVGLVFGLAPALDLTRRTASGLRAAGRNRQGTSARVRSVLVGGEVALSFVLLVGATLLMRSFLELRSVDPGFDPTGVSTVSLSFEEIDDRGERVATLDAVLERVRAVPGLAGAAAATSLPFLGSGGDTYVYAEGRPPEQIRNIQNTALIRTVDENYFETLGVAIERGRAFNPSDHRGAPLRVVINRALAERLFPGGEDPLGQRLIAELDTTRALEIIGVVSDVRQFAMSSPPLAEFHLSHRQLPPESVQLVVRGADGPPSLDAVREAVWSVAPSQPLTRDADLEDAIGASLAPGRFQALLLGLFSVLAVALAGIGLYGVLAEAVNERTREIGVRMAMGARPGSVVRSVVADGLRVALVGVTIGAVAALAATRLLTSLLYGVGPRDPLTFLVTPVFLIAVVLLSSWLPARQAARTDPVNALRAE